MKKKKMSWKEQIKSGKMIAKFEDEIKELKTKVIHLEKQNKVYRAQIMQLKSIIARIKKMAK